MSESEVLPELQFQKKIVRATSDLFPVFERAAYDPVKQIEVEVCAYEFGTSIVHVVSATYCRNHFDTTSPLIEANEHVGAGYGAKVDLPMEKVAEKFVEGFYEKLIGTIEDYHAGIRGWARIEKWHHRHSSIEEEQS